MEYGIPDAFWHYNRYQETGFSLSIRALPNRPSKFLSMLYHVFIMRYTDKLMGKIFKTKWVKYQEEWAYRKSYKALEKFTKK